MPRREYIDGKQAASFLGVKLETLYAYASRGLVESVAGEKGRGRRYRADDLERLKARHDARSGHGPVAAAALRWGEPVLESGVTGIDERGPRYRGVLAVDLVARGVSFERVAELLWTSALPDEAAWRPRDLGVKPADLAKLLPRGQVPPLGALALAIPALAAIDGERFGATVRAEIPRARALVSRLAALVCLAWDPRRATRALREPTIARTLLVAFGVKPTKRLTAAIDAALVLCADHELNPSSFTVRITASAGADLYACTSAALATLSGPRHGGSCDRVEALANEAGRPERAKLVVQERARRGELVPGFGHFLYPNGDPRCAPLLSRATAIARRSARVRTMSALVTAMRSAGQPAPTIDVGLVAIAFAANLPPGAAACIFAIGRTAGWVAHTIEQREAGFLLRPRARYVGK